MPPQVYLICESTRNAMGVEVSHEDVVIMEVKKTVKVRCEIGGTLLMVAVMERCSVMSSERKIESEGMEW